MHVADRLNELRARSGLSIDALAKAMGFAGASSIQRYFRADQLKDEPLRPAIIKKLMGALVGRGKPAITADEVRALGMDDSVEDIVLGLATQHDFSGPPKEAPATPVNAQMTGPVSLSSEHRIPVYGQAIGGDDGQFVLNGNHLQDVLAPPTLRGVKGAYGARVVGDSMRPRFRPDEVVYVNPNRPVRREDDVVAQIYGEDEETVSAYVKEFVKLNQKELVLRQYNPPKEISFPASRVKSVHRIVMSGES